MQREDTSKDEAIFPAPPLTPQGIEFRLVRNVVVRASTWKDGGNDKLQYLGGLGPTSTPAESQALQVVPAEKTWISDSKDEKQKGQWKQEVEFSSTFTLSCSPTFSTQTMTAGVSDATRIDQYRLARIDSSFSVLARCERYLPRPGK